MPQPKVHTFKLTEEQRNVAVECLTYAGAETNMLDSMSNDRVKQYVTLLRMFCLAPNIP